MGSEQPLLLPMPATRTITAILAVSAVVAAWPAAAVAHDEGLQPTHTVVEETAHGEVGYHSDLDAAVPDELVARVVQEDEWSAASAPGVAAALAPAPGDPSGPLSETWCGTDPGSPAVGQVSADDTADTVFRSGQAQFKVVYAYADGETNRFPQFADRLQADVSLLSRYMAIQSDRTKTIRFDMGTSCGAGYVDIQVLHLPQPKSSYVVNGAPQSATLRPDVEKAILPTAGRDTAVYADNLRGTNGVAGTALSWLDATAAGTPHNTGKLVAAVWGPSTTGSGPYVEASTMLHEMGHNLGAVQGSAPHSTGDTAGHCYDEWDVMCYADGGSRGQPGNLTYPCNKGTGVINESWDCGRDDYFSPSPPAGGYLATHWNTYRSAFLGDCASELRAACDSPPSPPSTTPTPVPSPAPTPRPTSTPTPAVPPAPQVTRPLPSGSATLGLRDRRGRVKARAKVSWANGAATLS